MKEHLRRIVNRLTDISVAVAAVALALIVVAYSYEVVSRYFFDQPTLWASDLVSFLLCISIFLMIPDLSRDGGHVKIAVLEEALSPAWSRRLKIAALILSGIVCLIVAAISGLENVRQFSGSITTVAVYPFPKWMISGAITFGFALSGINFLFASSDTSPSGNTAGGGI